MDRPSSKARERPLPIATVALWILAAILEGIDLQSAGIAGPGIRAEFHFDPLHLGHIFSIGTAALVVSAAFGGRLADRFGRKRVLLAAIAVFGLFSFATAFAWDYPSLLIARLLTGFGLGAAIPNLVALVAESTPARLRNTGLGLMYCGMPLGSALIALVGWMGLQHWDWRLICYVGGVAPLIAVPVLARYLPESPLFLRRPQQSAAAATAETAAIDRRIATTLFHGGRLLPTLTLWVASFCTYFVLYLLLSWLPTLLVNRGLSASSASGILILFNLGGIAGVIFSGVLMDQFSPRFALLIVYTGLIAVLLGLSNRMQSSDPHSWGLLACAFAADFFAASSQIIQYGLGSVYYDDHRRGTGLGAMVALGRAGAVAGPYLAGLLLSLGWGAPLVLATGVPGLFLSSLLLLAATAKGQPVTGRVA